MQSVVIAGAQWGDEGKGKIVDYLAQYAHVVVRYAGGNNAGHTVVVKGHKTILHLLPSGVLHPGKIGVLGNGMVVDPAVLLEEIAGLRKQGVRLTPKNLFISDRAHVILPYHRRVDLGRELLKNKKSRIGTTGRGIGPAYEDKASRSGLRLADLVDPGLLEAKLQTTVREKNKYLKLQLNQPGLSYKAVLGEYQEYGKKLRGYVTDTSLLLYQMKARGKKILIEGAQGIMLDIDHGTYPYVTSSNAGVGGVMSGCGVGPAFLQAMLGVIKAYTTRVGGGPFPTEQLNAIGEHLQNEGDEFGATTGRPRRCGWFDAVVARYSVRVNGFNGMVLTKLDTLTGMDPLRICTGYRVGRKVLTDFPADLNVLEKVRPIYEDLPGWKKPIDGARRMADLPRNTVRYVKRLEKLMGVPFSFVSVGPQREQTIILENPFKT